MSIENAVASTDLKHLTRQFYSAKALIISQQETIKHYSQKDFETNERRIKALQYSLNSEREMNANLTAELAELESKCERQASCNKELDKTNNELEKDLGLARLALEQKVNQLLSCESALAERDEKLAELEKELEKKESVILHMLQRDEAHNLSQQQLAVTRFANKYCGDCTTDYQVRLSTEAVMYCKYLEQPKEGE